ncbi:hypothetical protein PO124_07980 [Bacillus licheniformis]|nr:hypothetical protein [Bacillus licheniformis]
MTTVKNRLKNQHAWCGKPAVIDRNPQAEGGQTLISTELIIRNSVKHL